MSIPVTWSVYPNVNDEESSLGVGLEGMHISSLSSEWRSHEQKTNKTNKKTKPWRRVSIMTVIFRLSSEMSLNLVLCDIPCQAPGVLGAVLAPAGPLSTDRIVCLVLKACASRDDPGFESRCRRDFSGSSHTSDLNIGTQVATLPGAWRYRVSAGTGRPGVSIL